MHPVVAWWSHLRELSTQTLGVWWRVLPKVLIAWTLGWLIHQITLIATAPLHVDHPWLVVVGFSCGLVAYLAGIIIGIRLAGTPAGLWEMLPDTAARIGRDEPLLRVVSISLLPFIGVYSVFGGINQATYSLFIYGSWEHNVRESATSLLDPQTAEQRLQIGGVLVVCYLLRRGLEATADRLGSTILGLLGALVEGVFSVVLVFGGSRMIGDLGRWLTTRELWNWLSALWAWISDWLAALHEVIPEFIEAAWQYWARTLWPLISDGIMAPLLWLAVAGLVFGTYTLSAADLWEQGARSSGALRVASKRMAALQERGSQVSAGSRRVTLEFVDLFVGDLEDRIIPFIQSLRHVLRIGMPFMAAYVLVHALVAAVPPAVHLLAQAIIGGQEFVFWFHLNPTFELLGGLLGEPVRLSLLAVAMTLTLGANRERESDEASIASRAPGLVQAPAPRTPRRLLGRWLPAGLLTFACLLAAGFITHATTMAPSQDLRPVAYQQFGELVPGQVLQVSGVRAGKWIDIDGEPQWGLTTRHLFLAVDLWSESRSAKTWSLTCHLMMPPATGLGRIAAVTESFMLSPGVGFGRAYTLVFERPADGLVGAQVHCQPQADYRSHDRILVFDLAIDETRQAELAAQDGAVDLISRPEQEVLE